MSKPMRWKAALWLAFLYAFCILLPHAALALTGAGAHCLTEPQRAAHARQAVKTHVHADGGVHTHSATPAHKHADGSVPHQHAPADEKSHDGSCCGLFCISAIAHEAAAALAATATATRTSPALDDALPERGPDRINRPPIA